VTVDVSDARVRSFVANTLAAAAQIPESDGLRENDGRKTRSRNITNDDEDDVR